MSTVATTHGQFRVVDLGASQEQRWAWVEYVAGSERTMCSFVLFTDAVQMLPAYQMRETRERGGCAGSRNGLEILRNAQPRHAVVAVWPIARR